MNWNTKQYLTVIIAVSLVLTAFVPAGVAAQSEEDDGIFGGFGANVADSNGDGEVSAYERASAYVDGFFGYVSTVDVSEKVFGPPQMDYNASDKAQTLQDNYNAHNTTFENYYNNHWTANSNIEVVRIDIKNSASNSTVFLVANATDGNYTQTTMVDSTNKTVDEWVSLCDEAGKDAPTVLNEFRTEFAEDGEVPSTSYFGKMRGEYGGDVASSMLGDTQKCTATTGDE